LPLSDLDGRVNLQHALGSRPSTASTGATTTRKRFLWKRKKKVLADPVAD